MKALRSPLAQRLFVAAFRRKDLAEAIRNGEPFEFEGKRYVATPVPKATEGNNNVQPEETTPEKAS